MITKQLKRHGTEIIEQNYMLQNENKIKLKGQCTEIIEQKDKL
jgi:hypothetical protein